MNSFNELTWDACKKIPRGKVSTYLELAKAIGKPNATRAVGNALNKNQFIGKVPCHRVVKSSGQLGGFANGTKKKTAMLASEGIKVQENRVLGFREKLFKF